MSTVLFIILFAIAKLDASSGVPTTTTPTTTTTPPDLTSTTSRYDNPLVEHKHEQNCKALCEHCGCLGFYCGEECICECNDENSDTECIHTMQVNARTLNSPFEILIQGPSSNRFVRNAQQFEQRELVVMGSNRTTRNRRSTITIYKPNTSEGKKSVAFSLNALDTPSMGAKKSEIMRHKRSVEHLEWFNDFASTLVRPSPLGTRAKPASFKRQAAAVTTMQPLVKPHREPWFLEQTATRLNRPAPISRRRQQQSSRKTSKSSSRRASRPVSIEDDEPESESPKSESNNVRPFRDALQVVEHIPRVLQETVNHLTADNSKVQDVFSLNIMNDVLPKPMERREKAKRRFNERIRDIEVRTTAIPVTQAPVALPPTPLAPRGLLLPWLRQRRLRRMHGGQ